MNQNIITVKSLDNEEVVFDYSYSSGPALLEYSGKKNEYHANDSDVIDVEFTESIPESHKIDYSVAAASGLLCSLLDIFWVGQFSLKQAQEIGSDQAEKFVMQVAKKIKDENGKPFRGKTLEDAIKHLEERFPMAGDLAIDDFGGGLQHHFRDFTHHPTIVGLLFSLFAQFSNGIICGTDTNGNFKVKRIDPKTGYIGKNVPEKILFGTVNWMFHLVSDMAGSHDYPGKGTGIPGPILSFLKEASALPIVKDIRIQYKDEGDIQFSVWLSKLFNGTYFWNKETNEKIRFDLRTEMGITNYLLKQALPVIINECFVRGYFFTSRLIREIKDKDVQKIKDIKKIDPERIIPANNKVLARMLTISTGVFSVIDMGQAFAQAAKKVTPDKEHFPQFAAEFIARVNIPGIGRFAFALKSDAKYIFQDIKAKYDSYQNKVYTVHRELYSIPEWNTLSVTADQAVLLYSLEYQMLQHDLRNTKAQKAVEKKQHWISVWKDSIVTETAKVNRTLIEGEGSFYDALENQVAETNNVSWLYTVLIEALQFKAYTRLSDDKDNPYKGLKFDNNYLNDVFVEQQSIIDKKELTKIGKTYSNYRGVLQNSTTKVVAGVAGTVAITAVTGGAALAFAPEIATALVGSSFVGIYGAALTNASLAAIGGGALAAGGLGMAGGTAIIAGGGAVVGLVSGGAITASSAILGTSKDLTLDLFSKLLTVTKLSVIGKYHRKDIVNLIADNTYLMIARLEHDIEVMRDNLANADKEQTRELKKRIKTSKESLVYINRAHKELLKLQK